MNIVDLIVFGLIYLATFVPAWYLLFKLAIKLSARPRRWGRITITFVVYEVTIVLPYLYLLFTSTGDLSLVRELLIGLIVATIVTSLIQLRGLDLLHQNLWRFYAYFYDGLLNFYPYRELIQLVSERSQKFTHKGARVADVGAGTGNISRLLLERSDAIELDVVEPYAQMLKRARKKLAAVTSSSKVTFYQQSATEYLNNLKPGELDVVVLSNVLYTLQDRDDFWDALIKALASDGVAVITNSDTAGSSSMVAYHKQHDKFYKLLHPRLLMVGLIDNLISEFAHQSTYSFLPTETIAKELALRRAKMRNTIRCYGGEKHGVNLLFEVVKA